MIEVRECESCGRLTPLHQEFFDASDMTEAEFDATRSLGVPVQIVTLLEEYQKSTDVFLVCNECSNTKGN